MSRFRSPEIGSWGWEKPDRWPCCHRVGLSIQMTRVECLSPPTWTLPRTNHHHHHHLLPSATTSFCFSPIPIGRLHFRVFLFCFWTKTFPLKIPKHRTAFVKLELHGIYFFAPLVVVFNFTSFSQTKKKTNLLSTLIFQKRCRAPSFFYKVCSL